MHRHEPKGGIWGSRSIKWKMTRACFCAVGNEADEGELGARINGDKYKYKSDVKKSWGD